MSPVPPAHHDDRDPYGRQHPEDPLLDATVGRNLVQSALAAGSALAGPDYPGPAGTDVPYIVVPDGYQVHHLEELLGAPKRTRTLVKLVQVTSFTRYLNGFKTESTQLFADESRAVIDAVIDGAQAVSVLTPSWQGHRVTLQLVTTKEWNTWMGANAKRMDQVGFAEFLENNLPDIADPTGAAVLEMARSLELKKGVSFTSNVRLDNGQHQLSYQENIETTAAKGTLALVDTFTLGLAPFDGSPLYRVTARLRFRLNDNKLALWFDLARPQDVLRQAWLDVLKAIEAETKLVPFQGTTSGQLPLKAGA